MAYRLKDYLYNDKLTKEQNILMDRLYKLRMSGMAEAFEKQLLEPNTGLEPFEVRFAAIVNHSYFYFLYFYHISDKRYCFFCRQTPFCYIFSSK